MVVSQVLGDHDSSGADAAARPPWSFCWARAFCSSSVSLWVVSLLTFPLFLHELKVGSGSPPWGLKPIEAVHGVSGNLPALKVILTSEQQKEYDNFRLNKTE